MTNERTRMLVLVAVGVIALGGVAAFLFRKGDQAPTPAVAKNGPPRSLPVPQKLPPPSATPPPPAEGGHGASIDDTYATVLAMYKAPEGATACESAWNAITAEQDAAKSLDRKSIFSFVAKQAAFMKLCNALPADTQKCLRPRFEARNKQLCETAKPDAAVRDQMYVIRTDIDEPDEGVQVSQ